LIGFFLPFGIVPAVCLIGVFFWFRGSIETAYRAPIKDTAIALVMSSIAICSSAMATCRPSA